MKRNSKSPDQFLFVKPLLKCAKSKNESLLSKKLDLTKQNKLVAIEVTLGMLPEEDYRTTSKNSKKITVYIIIYDLM